MNRLLKYATTLWVFGAITYTVVTIGFLGSIDALKQVDLAVKTAPKGSKSSQETSITPGSGLAVSELVGSRSSALQAQPAYSGVAAGDPENAPLEQSWVEVETDVNVRSGPSASRPVISVQLQGPMLQVVSREKSWLEVIEPETRMRGWIFSRFVKASPGHQTAVFDAGER